MLVFETQDSIQNYKLQIHQFEPAFQVSPQAFLSPDELDYLQHIHHAKRKNEYLQTRFVLKSLLSSRIGLAPSEIRFEKIGQGKPILASFKGSPLDFNLSHSGEYFAFALSEKGYVGVDIEKIHLPSHFIRIADKYFSKQETDFILNAKDTQTQARAFTQFWSGKEAIIKTLGGGVFKNIHDIQIDSQSWRIQNLPTEFDDLSAWQLHFFEDIEGFICSLGFKKFSSHP